MHRLSLILLLSVAALAIPATSWAASTSANLAINVTAVQAITGVSLSRSAFTGGAPSGTVVGAISVSMSPTSPAFSGSLSLSGTNASNFQIVGSNLETNGVLPAGTYKINIIATEAGLTGSPFTQAETVTGTNPTAGGNVTFTPLHTYYMSPTGSDSNPGTAASPWATPNHSVVCGDVIIAAAGSYTSNNIGSTGFGTVSNCPSTSGGIDGTGGIYFATLLCGGSDLEACQVTGENTGANGIFNVSTNNWAIEGFKVNGSGNSRGFQSYNCTVGNKLHHNAFINDVIYNAASGYDIDDCGDPTHSLNLVIDYWATVGSIAENSSQDTICLAALDPAGPGNYDTKAGTHVYVYGNFVWESQQPACNAYDSEGIMFDTWDAHGFATQGVAANNIVWRSMRYGFQLFYQAYNVSTPTIKIYQNTFYGDLTNIFNDYADGEININTGAGNGSPYILTITDNIAQTNRATSGSGGPVYALDFGGGLWPNATIGGAESQNILKGMATSCAGDSCDPGNNAAEWSGNPLSTNTYVSPAFTNTTDLINNRSGAPNCTGFTSTTACMGWNANTQTLTTPSVISDLRPTASGMMGKGYQLPSTACAANADYPTWLKGIVYLHVSGSMITENSDLVTKPCGL